MDVCYAKTRPRTPHLIPTVFIKWETMKENKKVLVLCTQCEAVEAQVEYHLSTRGVW